METNRDGGQSPTATQETAAATATATAATPPTSN